MFDREYYMKGFFRLVISIFLTSVFFLQCVNACTVTDEPLRKKFRRSKAVFAAEVKTIKAKPNPDYGESPVDGEITFEISNSWKGGYKNRTTLQANVGFLCGCDETFKKFETGQKYIVFVDKKSVANFCDSQIAETERGAETADRLDKFRFRARAGVYPF